MSEKQQQQYQSDAEDDEQGQEEQQRQNVPERKKDFAEPTSSLPPPPSPRTHPKNNTLSKRDKALGPLRSHRQPLPNEMAELTPEEMPGGSHKDEKHSLSINISLDLLVEVHLTARVKGDITIGLL
ncbi:hypothetical protein IAT38_002205 [Cryptococcus sp. DSM 104549]